MGNYHSPLLMLLRGKCLQNLHLAFLSTFPHYHRPSFTPKSFAVRAPAGRKINGNGDQLRRPKEMPRESLLRAAVPVYD